MYPKFEEKYVSHYRSIPLAGYDHAGGLVFGSWDDKDGSWIGAVYNIDINSLMASHHNTDLKGDLWQVHIFELLPIYEPFRNAVIERYYRDGMIFLLNTGGALWYFQEGEFKPNLHLMPANMVEVIEQVKNYAV